MARPESAIHHKPAESRGRRVLMKSKETGPAMKVKKKKIMQAIHAFP